MLVPFSVENWVARPPMALEQPLVGRFVRVDPIDPQKDVGLLWEALGGNDGTLNERVKWWGMADFGGPEDLWETLRSIEEQEGWCVGVFRDLKTHRVGGMASYIATSPQHGTTEVGYVVHGPSMAQTPAATEAHYLLAKHALDAMGYRRLEWKCDAGNEASSRAALRYGYSYEGRFRQHRVTARATNRDTNWYSMLDSEWPANRAAFEEWLAPSNFDDDGRQIRRLGDLRAARSS